MRNIGKAVMLLIVTTILVLLMGKIAWACRLKNCKEVSPGVWHCELKCTDYQARSTGIGRITLFGRPGVALAPDPENPPRPGNWISERFQTGIDSYAVNLIPVPPITDGGRWEITFKTDKTAYKEIEAFVAEIREADSDHLKERFHLEELEKK